MEGNKTNGLGKQFFMIDGVLLLLYLLIYLFFMVDGANFV
jgi:hypothetical protein